MDDTDGVSAEGRTNVPRSTSPGITTPLVRWGDREAVEGGVKVTSYVPGKINTLKIPLTSVLSRVVTLCTCVPGSKKSRSTSKTPREKGSTTRPETCAAVRSTTLSPLVADVMETAVIQTVSRGAPAGGTTCTL